MPTLLWTIYNKYEHSHAYGNSVKTVKIILAFKGCITLLNEYFEGRQEKILHPDEWS
jgi:hypothetical protein